MVTGQPTSESDEGQAAPRMQSDGYGLPCDTGTDCRPAPGKYPTTLAEPPRSQRYMGPPAGRSGWVDACSLRATRTEASGRKALAKLRKPGKSSGNEGKLTTIDFD